MKIQKTINKIPGGAVAIPLLIGAILNTFAGDSLVNYFGDSLTGSFLAGTNAILWVFYFCVGASVNVRNLSARVLGKGLALVGGKVLVAWLIGWIAGLFIPVNGVQTGLFAGLSTMALVVAFSQTNGGLYLSVMGSYEDRDEDVAAFPFIALEQAALISMLILGTSTGESFSWASILSTLIPFFAGILLGNLDLDIHEKFSPGVGILIPFFMFTIGFGLDLRNVLRAGLTGILVGIAVVFISGVVMALLDKLLAKGDGLAGWAAASTAGAASSAPAILASANDSYAAVADSATAIVAASVIVTSILVPIWVNHMAKRKDVKKVAADADDLEAAEVEAEVETVKAVDAEGEAVEETVVKTRKKNDGSDK